MDTYKTSFRPTDRQSWITALPFLPWCLGADSKEVAGKSIQTSLSHQSTIREPKGETELQFSFASLGS